VLSLSLVFVKVLATPFLTSNLWMSLLNTVLHPLLAVASPGLDQASSLPHLFRFTLLLSLLFTAPMLVSARFPLLELPYLLGAENVYSPVFIIFVFSYSMSSYNCPQNQNTPLHQQRLRPTGAVAFRPDVDQGVARVAKESRTVVLLALFARPQRCLSSNSPLCCGLGTLSIYGITSPVLG